MPDLAPTQIVFGTPTPASSVRNAGVPVLHLHDIVAITAHPNGSADGHTWITYNFHRANGIAFEFTIFPSQG